MLFWPIFFYFGERHSGKLVIIGRENCKQLTMLGVPLNLGSTTSNRSPKLSALTPTVRFVFFINLMHHQHSVLRHCQALIDRLFTFLMMFSILVLKLSSSQSLSLHSHLFLAQAHLLEFYPLGIW